jgi:hypothetical protein
MLLNNAGAPLNTRATFLTAISPFLPLTPLTIDRARHDFTEAFHLFLLGALATTIEGNNLFEASAGLHTLSTGCGAFTPTSPRRDHAVHWTGLGITVVHLLQHCWACHTTEGGLRHVVPADHDFATATGMTAKTIFFPLRHRAILRTREFIARKVLLHVCWTFISSMQSFLKNLPCLQLFTTTASQRAFP